MPDKSPVKITICMGSSCFSRGNNRNVEALQEYLKKNPLPPAVELAGHLCQGNCQLGPNAMVNGNPYYTVDLLALTSLIRHYSGGKHESA
jgi:NADH:ubiquinone oxidoreductase subunit E